jgi:hypothetical protein
MVGSWKSFVRDFIRKLKNWPSNYQLLQEMLEIRKENEFCETFN